MAFTTREGKTQTTLAEINMIPFIDIVLVLADHLHGDRARNSIRH